MTRSGKSFADIMEKMPSLDAVTVLVLAADAYILYSSINYYNRGKVFSVSTEPRVLAIQASAVLALFYVLEFIHDRRKDSRRHR